MMFRLKQMLVMLLTERQLITIIATYMPKNCRYYKKEQQNHVISEQYKMVSKIFSGESVHLCKNT